MTKPKAIILMGPTASGKTQLAVQLAKKTGGEIISADSRQVYKSMDIGTGKDLNEYGCVPYHLIDVVEAGKEFSVSDFQKLAWQVLVELKGRSVIPILCGGTGHYVKSLIDDYQFNHKKSDLLYTLQLEAKPAAYLHQKLKDLGLWEAHHWENDSKRRMARAIEKQTRVDKPLTTFPSFKSTFDYRIFYTSTNRKDLKKRITTRLIHRLKEGMVKETQELLDRGMSHARLERYGLEYKFLSRFIRGEISEDQLIEKLTVEISRFAKRQMTFIRYMEKNGHKMIPIKNFDELWSHVSQWAGERFLKV